jgi:hypothetical protein
MSGLADAVSSAPSRVAKNFAPLHGNSQVVSSSIQRTHPSLRVTSRSTSCGGERTLPEETRRDGVAALARIPPSEDI